MDVAESAPTSTGFSDNVLCHDKQVQNVKKKPQVERVARAQYPDEKLYCARAATVPVCEMLSHLWLYMEAFGYSQTCSDHTAMTKAD